MAQQIWTTLSERVTTSHLTRFGVSLLIALFLWGTGELFVVDTHEAYGEMLVLVAGTELWVCFRRDVAEPVRLSEELVFEVVAAAGL